MIKFLAKNIFPLIGGIIFGFGLPIGRSVFNNKLLDFLILCPIGLLILGISYYYSFIKK